MKKRLKRVFQVPPVRFTAQVVQLYFSEHVSRAAAQLAYLLILTFFPILICITAFLSRVNLTTGDLLENAAALFPEGVVSIFSEYLGYLDKNLSTAMLVAGIVLTVFFASAAIRGLMTFMQELYGEASFRGVRRLAASILFALLLLVIVYLSMVVVVTGNWFFRMLGNFLGLTDLAERFGIWQWMKYLILLAIVFLFILLLYRFTVPLRTPRLPVIPGALLASGALVVASAVFAFVVGRSARYPLIYGSLASVIILLVWLYLCGNVLILGNVVNYVIHRRRQQAQ